MLLNTISVICAVVAAVAAGYIVKRYGDNGRREWFWCLALGFLSLGSDIHDVGRGWTGHFGMPMLAIAMVLIAININDELSKKK